MSLPVDVKERKSLPIGTGVLDYFPNALAEVARVSRIGNDQHNPGQPLHWDKSKSSDEADCLIRHFLQRGTKDSDGALHSAKVAWRALALLERELTEPKKAAQVEAPKCYGCIYLTGNLITISPKCPAHGLRQAQQ